ncbi:aminotransferase class V-fold PLP-dependent enzyme, partial [Schumannella luteola]
MLYLDTAATTPTRREVLETMWPYLTGEFGNPSSHHQLGERAAHAVQAARATIAEQLGCRPSEIVLTSGGTEADNLAIKGIALAQPRGRHLVTTAIEHEAVRESADYLRRLHGFEVTELPVDEEGLVSAAALAAALRPDTTLVSIQHANNEIGVVQPIRELAAVVRDVGVPFHTDAVQSADALEVGLEQLGVDAVSVAGHKLGAPKGIGALAVRAAIPLEPLLHGG